MATVQDLVIPHTNCIHILPDLAHDYPRHIPRRLPMPGQDVLVVPLHPCGVLEGMLLDLPLLEVLTEASRQTWFMMKLQFSVDE